MPSSALRFTRLDRRGIAEILRSEPVQQMVNAAALDIQMRVRAKLPPGARVLLEPYTTDRAAAAVVIADVRGMAWQARDGVFTRSVHEAGIEFKAWRT